MAVAMLLAANVLLPVDPVPAAIKVSDVIAIVTVPAPVSFTNPIAVPTGNATLELAGIVKVLGVISALG